MSWRKRPTDSMVRDLIAPAVGNRITYDTEVKGLRCADDGGRCQGVCPSNYRASGRERRITIGSFPDWTSRRPATTRKASSDKSIPAKTLWPNGTGSCRQRPSMTLLTGLMRTPL